MKEYTREDVNTLRVGMKMVCIKRGQWSFTQFKSAPRYGEIVTIRAIGWSSIGTAILFDEHRNPDAGMPDPFPEPSFAAIRFRPLVTKTLEQDMAVFTHLLTNLPIHELAAEEAGSNVDRVDGLLLALNACWERYGVEEDDAR